LITVLGDETSCGLVDKQQQFEETCCLLLQDKNCPLNEGSRFFETLVPIYQTVQRHSPEDSNLDAHQRENLKSLSPLGIAATVWPIVLAPDDR
jgi:hypothetical protein